MDRTMVIHVEWVRNSLLYERLSDIADVLGVDVAELLAAPGIFPRRHV